MTHRGVTVRRADAEDIPGLVASSSRLFAEDAGTRDPSVDINWPREHGTDSYTAALEDPARLVLVAEQAEVAAYSANADAVRFYERHGFGPQLVTLRRAIGDKSAGG